MVASTNDTVSVVDSTERPGSVRVCVVCSIPLVGRATKFCSKDCREAEYAKTLAVRKPAKPVLFCKNCNGQLTGRQTEWCSMACKREYGNEVVLLNDIATLTRTCTKCKLRKVLAADFYQTPAGTYRRVCKACVMVSNDARNLKPDVADKRRDQHLRGLYGIDGLVYEALLREQDGRCAVCRKPPLRKRLSVDHDHVTGKIRGLLCNYCNLRIIGKMRDAALYRAAAAYLESPPAVAILGDEHLVPKGAGNVRRKKRRKKVVKQ